MGSRQERAEESRVERQRLEDTELQSAVHSLAWLMAKARGPHGRIQTLRNNVGGPATMTTSSSRLLSALSVFRPILRVVESAVQGHLKTHQDGGLLTGSLCLHLVLNAVRLEGVGRLCVREAYGAFLQLIDDYLNTNDCPISVRVDAANLKVMLGYVRNLVGVKPVCQLRGASADHVSRMVLKAFLTSVPDGPQAWLSDQVFVLQQDKAQLASSQLMEGLLLDWPEKCARLGPQDVHVIRDSTGVVKIALVNVSMSGDAEESLSDGVEGRGSAIQSAADLILSRTLALCEWVVKEEVGVVVCQKVMHPKVKAYLRRSGVIFMERVGLMPVPYLQDLTGAVPISSVLVRPGEGVCGRLTSVQHRVLHGKSYLHLTAAHTCVSTLLLCAPVEQQLAELKCAVQSALTGLRSVFQRPYLLCGAGCWQLHLAAYLTRIVRTRGHELCEQLSLTEAQLQTCAGAFVNALKTVAFSSLPPHFQPWVDQHHGHLWPAPSGLDLTGEPASFTCACAMLSSQDVDRSSLRPLLTTQDCQSETVDGVGGGVNPTRRLEISEDVNVDWLVLDSMECAISAIRTAVVTACVVLSFTQFIHDVN